LRYICSCLFFKYIFRKKSTDILKVQVELKKHSGNSMNLFSHCETCKIFAFVIYSKDKRIANNNASDK